MANGDRPNLRFQPSVDITGIARLIAQRPVQEEQLRASQEQRAQSRFQSILQAAKLGSTLAQQASAASESRQLRRQKTQIQDVIDSIAGSFRTRAERISTEEVPGGIGPVTPEGVGVLSQEQRARQEQFETRAQLVEIQQKDALKAVTQEAFPEAGLGTKGGVPQKVNLLFPDGTVELGFFDPATKKLKKFSGEDAPLGTKQAFSEGARNRFFTDAQTGKRFMLNLVDETVKELKAPEGVKGFTSVGDLTLAQRDRINKDVDRWTKDDIRKASQNSLSQISTLQEILLSDIGAASEPLKSLIARVIAGEKGVLTDKDVARNSGNQAIIARAEQLMVKWSTGKFSERNKKEFNNLIKLIKRNSTRKTSGKNSGI